MGAAVLALTAGCSTYHAPPPPEVSAAPLSRGDRVHVLTRDGERFHATVSSLHGTSLLVRDKAYEYQDGARAEAQRSRNRYELAELTFVRVQGPPRLERKVVTGVLLGVAAVSLLFPPVIRE